MQVTTQDVFPTRIWVFDLPELAQFKDAWVQDILEWRAKEPQPAGRSNRKGWNTHPIVFTHEKYKPLQELANRAFLGAFNDMQLAKPFKFALQAWVNLHDPGSYNAMHVHANVLMSGCYYLKVPERAGPIRFRDPRTGVVVSPFVNGGINTYKDILIHPKEGQLVVFPNWLDHEVDVNEADEERIAIAMNAYLLP